MSSSLRTLQAVKHTRHATQRVSSSSSRHAPSIYTRQQPLHQQSQSHQLQLQSHPHQNTTIRHSSSFSAQQRQRRRVQSYTTFSPAAAVANYHSIPPSAPSMILATSQQTSATAATASAAVDPPSSQALQALFLQAAVPMIGFGAMDNIVMIQAGSYIDSTLGLQLGLATLTAAAAGQVVSDVSGVIFGSQLEAWLNPYLPAARLTVAQRALPVARRVALLGAVCGVTLGCALGASTLWCLDLDARERAEAHAQLDEIVRDLQRYHSQESQEQQQSSLSFSVQWLEKDDDKKKKDADQDMFLRDNQPSADNNAFCIYNKKQEVVGHLTIQQQQGEEPDSLHQQQQQQQGRLLAAHLSILYQRIL